jgi:outer membrane immunogenic protein
MSQFFVTGQPAAPALRPLPISSRMAFSAALVLALPLAPAQAADLPAAVKTKAPVPPAYSWAGCYLGANAGGGTSGASFTTSTGAGTHLSAADAAAVDAAANLESANSAGFLGGGQAGCNWQSGTIVYGLEGDFDYFSSNPQSINGSGTLSDGVTPFTVGQSVRTDFFATVRPRIGVAADRNLAYITGGAAFSRVSYTLGYADGGAPAGSGTAAGSKMLTGWTVGAGWEHAFVDHWTVKLEYLFSEFPGIHGAGVITDAGGGANPIHGAADLTVQTLRAGVNYKF